MNVMDIDRIDYKNQTQKFLESYFELQTNYNILKKINTQKESIMVKIKDSDSKSLDLYNDLYQKKEITYEKISITFTNILSLN